jgi:membrane associated rhomboid family serine protease
MGIFRYYPEDQSAHDKELDKRIFRHSFAFAFFFVFLFWLVRIIEDIFSLDLYKGGIYPLHLKGLPGILTSPFIHSGYEHLISNTLPFFILLFALVYYYRSLSYRIFFQIYLLAGICVWLAARESWHIGASGVVYGMAAFHFASGVIRNDLRLLVISVVVVFLYGGMIWGMLPIKPEISWESHIAGGVSGVIMALAYRKYTIRRKKFDWEDEPDSEEEPEIFPADSGSSSPEPGKSLPGQGIPSPFGEPTTTYNHPTENSRQPDHPQPEKNQERGE